MSYIKQVSDEKDVALAALCDNLNVSRATLYRHGENDLRETADHQKKIHNALNIGQKQEILELLRNNPHREHPITLIVNGK